NDRLVVPLRQGAAHALAEPRIGVQPGARRSSADADLTQLPSTRAQASSGALDAARPSADLLAIRDRDGVLQVRAPGLHEVRVLPGLRGENIGELVQLLAQRLRELAV